MNELKIGSIIYIVEDFKSTVDFIKCEITDKNDVEIIISVYSKSGTTHKSRSIYLNQTNRFITDNKLYAKYMYLALLLKYSDIETLSNNSFLLNKIRNDIGLTEIFSIKDFIKKSIDIFPEKWI